jgi:LPXTG-motif cell wall-anchored protein
MSLTRRLAAGLPAAGVTVLAALALSGAPASAAGDDAAVRAGQPAVMTTPCTGTARECPTGYGYQDASETPGDDAAGAGAGAGDDGHTRGNGGYGSVGPSVSPTPSATTPTGGTDTVPPGGVSPTTATPSPSSPGGGVSAGGNLPVTGAPSGVTIALGGALVAAGAAAIWYTRRRRSA